MTTSAVLPGRDFCFPREVFLMVIMQVADYRIVYGVDIKPREPGWITGGRSREGTGGGWGGAVRGGGREGVLLPEVSVRGDNRSRQPEE